MKKSNAITFLSLCLLIILVILFMVGAKKSAENTEITTAPTQTEAVSEITETPSAEPSTEFSIM